jgi:hypothetical protein
MKVVFLGIWPHKRIPHPWWHWFFCSLLKWSEDDNGLVAWEQWRCTKCKRVYHLILDHEPAYEEIQI